MNTKESLGLGADAPGFLVPAAAVFLGREVDVGDARSPRWTWPPGQVIRLDWLEGRVRHLNSEYRARC